MFFNLRSNATRSAVTRLPLVVHHLLLFFSDWPIYDGDLDLFQNDWIEVATESLPAPPFPEFLSPDLDLFRQKEDWLNGMSGRFHKFVTFDTDHNSRSERKEWGHLKYQRRFLHNYTFTLLHYLT